MGNSKGGSGKHPGLYKARANGWTGGAAPPGIKICSAQQRRRTPLAFAEMLLSLAALADRTEGS
jgi:hypothetical protein